MFPNFAALPPEVNAAKLANGAGWNSTENAGEAWRALADKLAITRADMRNALDALAAGWWSRAAAQMMAEACAYNTWLYGLEYRARQVGDRADAYWHAYARARAAMVSLQDIQVNRNRCALLVNGNIGGKNTPAIASFEDQYEEYWETNARAMNTYAHTISNLPPLEPFVEAPQIISEQRLADVSKALLTAQQLS
ncbi:PPE family protein [Mycobacterium haemophilum DSM 44634]|uniref:PPE family protein n=1 Tax=Mycobacterium haemophilum TaxID=29311 RepID=UPI0006D3C5CD|nr:PPE family protein [Mycobacterium haemophilum]ALL56202.1 hypothetical protein B586_01555 [Mycobacterium haemophilum DSM 44634]MCV7342596.1 PPE family protein [Mycobacterium haemophilum DSM 44634]